MWLDTQIPVQYGAFSQRHNCTSVGAALAVPQGAVGVALVQLPVVISKVQGINYGLACKRKVVMADM